MKMKKKVYGSGPFTAAEVKAGYKKCPSNVSGEYPEWTRQIFNESGKEDRAATIADYQPKEE